MRLTAHSPNVLVNETTGNVGPRTVEIDGRTWHRFMDYLYVPAPPAQIDPDLVREVCEVRYRQRNWVIDWTLHSTVQAAMLELVRDAGLTPARVLDFGTGSGVSAETLRAVLTTRVVGCDMSWQTLAAAGMPNTVAVAPDGPLPFASRAFDLVHCLFVMHFKIPDRMLQELRRCTAGHGYLAANCYGSGIDLYRERMHREGWDLAQSRPVERAEGHIVDLWHAQR
jgi:hypothetical protein